MSELERTRERTLIEFDPYLLDCITHLGRLDYKGAHPSLPAHFHRDTLEICYVARGNPVFTVGKEEFRLRGGDVFLSFPNEVHGSGDYPEDRMNLYWLGVKIFGGQGARELCVGEEESRRLLESLKGMKMRHFRGKDSLKRMIDRTVDLYFSGDPFRLTRMRNGLAHILITLIELEKGRQPPYVSPAIAASMEKARVLASAGENLSLESLADETGLSLSRFKQRFKTEAGVPPGEFFLREKVSLASERLIFSGQSVTRVALDLGFSSSQYFATVFKRFTGRTPTEYLQSRLIGRVAQDTSGSDQADSSRFI